MTSRSPRVQPPSYRDGPHLYRADVCDPIVEAASRGVVELAALSRGHYPGRPLGGGGLGGVKSIGFWDAAGPQDWGLDWHRNEGLELTFVESGQLAFAVDDERFTLGPGDLTITRPWQCHRVGDPSIAASRLHWLIVDLGVRRPNQAWRWPKWIVLTAADLERLTHFLRHQEHPVWSHPGSDMRRCWQRIARAVEHDRDGDRVSHLTAYLNEVFVLILEMFDQQQVQTDRALSGSRRTVRLFFRDLAHDREKLAHPWQVGTMAGACGLGVTQFTMHCKQLANVSPMQHLQSLRVEAAKRMFGDGGEASVTEVAFACGFSSSQYFAAIFRRHTGMTPTVYRQRAKAKPRMNTE